jgi:3-hydroxybutyrate dehydrogenase
VSNLINKHVVITGASRGLGRATAAAFLRAGAQVEGTGRDTKALAETRKMLRAISPNFRLAKLEVTDEAAVVKYFGALSRVDILINNAGIARAKAALATSAAELREVLEVNVVGAFIVMREAARKMAAQGGGHIINIASDAAVHGIAGMAPYVASKHALLGLGRSLSQELRKDGVRVTTFCPGPIDTDIFGPGTANLDALPATELAEMLVQLAGQSGRLETQEILIQPTWLKEGA